MISESELVRAARVFLADYMAVARGESVLITADRNADLRLVDALVGVAAELDAKPAILLAPPLPYQGQLANPYITDLQKAAFAAADVWIDLAFPYFAGCEIHDELMKAKRSRYVLVGDVAADGFVRLFGKVDLDLYFEAQCAFDAVFGEAAGAACRITSPLGTDVTFKLTKSGFTKPRRATAPGMYLVPGSCSISNDVDSVVGRVAVSAAFHEYYERLETPIMLEVDGTIRKVIGGGHSRFPLERAILRAGGGKFGSIIHFTHGLHPAARVTGKSFIEDMRTIGSNAVGLGIPWWLPGGGENHPDTIVTQHSVFIDGKSIVVDGEIVGPPDLAKCAARLVLAGG